VAGGEASEDDLFRVEGFNVVSMGKAQYDFAIRLYTYVLDRHSRGDGSAECAGEIALFEPGRFAFYRLSDGMIRSYPSTPCY
jgi:hypothetical protein